MNVKVLWRKTFSLLLVFLLGFSVAASLVPRLKFAHATVYLSEDFEDWNVNSWTNSTAGTLEVQSSVTFNYTGYALHTVGGTGGSNTYIEHAITGQTENWLHFAFHYVSGGPVATASFRQSTWKRVLAFTTDASGYVKTSYYANGGALTNTSSTVQLTPSVWVQVDIHYNVSDTAGCVQVFIDGEEVEDLTMAGLNTAGNTPDKIRFGAVGDYATSENYIDETFYSDVQVEYVPPEDHGTVSFSHSIVSDWLAGATANFSTNASTSAGTLSHHIYGSNASGSWVNSSATDFSGSTWVNFSAVMPDAGEVVQWRAWANNSYGVWGASSLFTIKALDAGSPFLTFGSSKGILMATGGAANRTHLKYVRMQLSAEINNSATEADYILVPSGGYWGGDAQFHFTSTSWSEGGINFEYLKRNLAWCWDNDYVPILALWITNLDPLVDRTYVCDEGNLTVGGLPLEMANSTGWTNFLSWLKAWKDSSGYSSNSIVFEPCWEFNIYPWTDWGGAGVGRYWAVTTQNYYNAMSLLMDAKSSTGFDKLIVASHIVPWTSEQWVDRGKVRITTDYDEDGYTFQDGMLLCDVWGVSMYGAYNITSHNDVLTYGVTGYVDWVFDSLLYQYASDEDLGDKFIGTFEYNMPEELYDLDTGTGYSEAELEQMAMLYINYTYSLVPTYFGQGVRLLGWWMPVDTTTDMLNEWLYWTAYYDGYGSTEADYVVTLTPTTTGLTQGETVSITVSVTKDGEAFTDYVANVTRDGELFKQNVVPANSTFTDQELTATSHTYSVSSLTDSGLGEAVSFSISPVTVYWNVPPSSPPTDSTSPPPDGTEPEDSEPDVATSGLEVDEWVIFSVGIAAIVLIAVIFVFAVSKEDKRSRGYRW